MGSIGQPAYDHLNGLHPSKVVGIDFKHDNVEVLKEKDTKQNGAIPPTVFLAFRQIFKIKLVLLAMSDFNANNNTLTEIMKMKRRKFKVAAVTHYPEEIAEFEKRNVDYIYDYKSNIGADFAEQNHKRVGRLI